MSNNMSKEDMEKQYQKDFQEFSNNFMGLNEWGRIEVVFNMRMEIEFLKKLVKEFVESQAESKKST